MGTTTILIVDDEPANLSLLTHLLRPLYQVRAANSGENALRAASSEPRPTLVLLDVMIDPDIVTAFLESFDAMTAIADQYKDRVSPQR